MREYWFCMLDLASCGGGKGTLRSLCACVNVCSQLVMRMKAAGSARLRHQQDRVLGEEGGEIIYIDCMYLSNDTNARV